MDITVDNNGMEWCNSNPIDISFVRREKQLTFSSSWFHPILLQRRTKECNLYWRLTELSLLFLSLVFYFDLVQMNWNDFKPGQLRGGKMSEFFFSSLYWHSAKLNVIQMCFFFSISFYILWLMKGKNWQFFQWGWRLIQSPISDYCVGF